MKDPDPNAPTPRCPAGRFLTTHWSVVLAAKSASSPKRTQALSTLCETYWFPLYAFLRRNGYDAARAEDFAQAFFAQLLDKEYLNQVEPEKGKFRTFLLTALKHFVSKQHKYDRALKRGGGRKILSLDFEDAETRYSREPADRLTPEMLFERSWALTVLRCAMDRLYSEASTPKKKRLFDQLSGLLTADKASLPYSTLAKELEMTEGAVKVAVHRLRNRYREILRDEIAQTVTDEQQIDDEIRDLFTALGS